MDLKKGSVVQMNQVVLLELVDVLPLLETAKGGNDNNIVTVRIFALIHRIQYVF